MLEYFVNTYGNQLLMLLLTALFGMLGFLARRTQERLATDETKRAVARTAAQFVEQVWKNLHGPDKLRKALETAEGLLQKKGVPFDAGEMEILIEAAVGEFNRSFLKKTLR